MDFNKLLGYLDSDINVAVIKNLLYEYLGDLIIMNDIDFTLTKDELYYYINHNNEYTEYIFNTEKDILLRNLKIKKLIQT